MAKINRAPQGGVNHNHQFLEMIFGDEWREAEICSVPVLGDDKTYRSYWTTRPAGAWLASGHMDPKWNNYFCVSTMKTPGARRKAEFKALHVLVIDDVGTKVDPDKVKALFPGPASYTLETSPDNYQWGYVLDPPITDLSRAESLINRTIVALTGDAGTGKGKDPGMAGVTRLMRLMDGTNTKTPSGHRVNLFARHKGAWTHYTAKDLEQNLPPDPNQAAAPVMDPWDPPTEPDDPFDNPATPVPGRSLSPGRPDPTLRAMQSLGLVLSHEHQATQGTGWDVICPWHDEHSPTGAQDTGTMYFRGGGFKCWHGHCANRTPEDVRSRVNQLLSDTSGGLLDIDQFDPNRLTVVDPTKVPPSPLPPEPDVVRRFWGDTVWWSEKNKFIDVTNGTELDERAFDLLWGHPLRDHLPTRKTSRGESRMPPALWYHNGGSRRRVVEAKAWDPAQPRLFIGDAEQGGQCSYLNLWSALSRPLRHVPDAELDRHVRDSDWWKLIDALNGPNGDGPENARRLRTYMAMTVGAPHVKPGHNPLTIGRQGIGKDQIWRPLMDVLGPGRALTLDQDLFNGTYTSWVFNRLVVLTEIKHSMRGFTNQYERLKLMCDPGRDRLTINDKYVKHVQTANRFVLVITTNDDQPMMLPQDDRRMWIIQARETGWDVLRHQRLADWYEAASPWDATNSHAVVEWLIRHWDRHPMLDEVTGHAPMTDDKRNRLHLTISAVEAWILETLGRTLPDILALPDMFTAGEIVDRFAAAVRHGGQGVSPDTRIPSADTMGHALARTGCRRLHNGQPVGPVRLRLWARPDADPKYDVMSHDDLVRAWAVLHPR